ncbi:glycoside hydrolase family 16 protein [Parvularcula sp. LCG005]|uniref:glycoside hydrolase family 16 protein n=1 Tax=Parvularcula sp. LCG005 TaxID=3078805 RepID=UPI00294378C8|nr:glycoside hydrolase family 16 protein [Parvularcula sp. LCG005]WOI52660.1 glycoside hydrolase family 16 protein [Parvularcula sp. LCG005]
MSSRVMAFIILSSLPLALSACADTAAEDAAASEAEWQTVWADEFDGDALDRSKWAPEESCWGGGNFERQCYTGRDENIRVDDGMLILSARAEKFTGPIHPPELRQPGEGTVEKSYTSGKVRTKDLASWTYGRFSARMKLPEGQGTWPAFWMMPEGAEYGRWPLSGEIDIMEGVNLRTPCAECPGGTELRTIAALHFGELPPKNTYLATKTTGEDGIDPVADWHVYSVEWGQDRIQWFVDDTIFIRLEADDWFSAAENATGPGAPFDKPFYLMLNLAVGGLLPENENGEGFDPASIPADFQIDWVRVEQCKGDEETGMACLSDAPWAGSVRGPSENY